VSRSVSLGVAPRVGGMAFGNLVVRFLIALSYAVVLFVGYRELSYWWSYAGFAYRPVNATVLAVVLIAAAFPAAFLPAKAKTFGQFAIWLMYFALLMPSMIIPPLQGYVAPAQSFALFVALLVSTILLILFMRFNVRGIRFYTINARLFWAGMFLLWAGLHGLILFVFGNSLSFAGLDTVYEQRAAGGALTSGLFGYVAPNLSGAINPFLIAVGLKDRRLIPIAMGVAGQALCYTTVAAKVVLASTALIFAVFFLFDRYRRFDGNRFAAAMLAVGVIGIPLIFAYDPDGNVMRDITDIIYFRTLYLPGVLTGVYFDFFTQFPVTYLSHSLVGAAFSANPYQGLSIGQVIGDYVTPSGGYVYNNYNANFIAADGITGFGVAGVPFIIAVTALILRGIDYVTARLDLRVVCAGFVPFVMALSDGSVFTSLLTSGGLLLAILFYLWGGTLALEKDNP
jgi:hypothetical protein